MTLYVTTCFLPLFLMLAHLPPGRLNLVPVVRWRGYTTALHVTEEASGSIRGDEVGVRDKGDHNGGETRHQGLGGRGAHAMRGADALHHGIEKDASLGLGKLRTLEEGNALEEVGNGSTTSNARSNRSSHLEPQPSTTSSTRWSDGVQSWSSAVSQRIVSGANEIVHDFGSGVTGLMETIATPMMGITGGYRHTAVKPTFCLETSLWAVNLSNLVYWDIPPSSAGEEGGLGAPPSAPPAVAGGFDETNGTKAHATRRPSDASQENRNRAGTSNGERSRTATATTDSSSGVMRYGRWSNLEHTALFQPITRPPPPRHRSKTSHARASPTSANDLEGLTRNGMRILAQIDDDDTDTHVVLIGDASSIWIGFEERRVKGWSSPTSTPSKCPSRSPIPEARPARALERGSRTTGATGTSDRARAAAVGSWLISTEAFGWHTRGYKSSCTALYAGRLFAVAVRQWGTVARRGGGGGGAGNSTQFSSGPGEYTSIICVGHSLGGALASICALDIACCQQYGACLVCPLEEGVWTHPAKDGDVPAGAAEAAAEALEAAITARRRRKRE